MWQGKSYMNIIEAILNSMNGQGRASTIGLAGCFPTNKLIKALRGAAALETPAGDSTTSHLNRTEQNVLEQNKMSERGG